MSSYWLPLDGERRAVRLLISPSQTRAGCWYHNCRGMASSAVWHPRRRHNFKTMELGALDEPAFATRMVSIELRCRECDSAPPGIGTKCRDRARCHARPDGICP
jgi:hypothetical protein